MLIKKLLSLGLVLTLTSSMIVGCTSSGVDNENESDDEIKVTMIADVGGINDQSFNQSAWEGLKRAEKELGVEVSVIESKQMSDYEPNVETAVDEEADLIIGIGFQMDNAIKTAAENYPDQKFAIIDHAFEEQPSNVNSIMFNAEEASYLVGLIAGMVTETDKVGFIGGSKTTILESFEYGFLSGAEDSNSNISVLRQYADTYTDASKGKAIAKQMYSDNADIIFTAAGSTGLGAIEAARENNKKAIGVDMDQNFVAPEHIITSAVKRVDNAVFNTIKDLQDGKFKGGEVSVYGLKEDGVGIAETTKNLVSEDILAFVEEQSEKIKNGEITIPKNEEEYKNQK